MLLCSPGAKDGFGSQYLHKMAAFGACAEHGNCCYVHASLAVLAHGANVRRAERLTGLESDAWCRPWLVKTRRNGDPAETLGCTNARVLREGPTVDWHISVIEWARDGSKCVFL